MEPERERGRPRRRRGTTDEGDGRVCQYDASEALRLWPLKTEAAIKTSREIGRASKRAHGGER